MAKITFKINTLDEVEAAIKVLKGIKKAIQSDVQALDGEGGAPHPPTPPPPPPPPPTT